VPNTTFLPSREADLLAFALNLNTRLVGGARTSRIAFSQTQSCTN
jgi:hypothetical protein